MDFRAEGLRCAKAQGAIEYLLIIGAAILVVAIVIIAVTGALGQGTSQASASSNYADSSFDNIKESSGQFVRIAGNYYSKSSSVVSSLAGAWNFAGNSNDSSPNGNNASLLGSTPPVYIAGPNNFPAVNFTGALGQRVEIPNSSAINFGPREDFSVSFWINNRLSGYGKIFGKKHIDELDKGYSMWAGGSALFIKISNGSASFPQVGFNVPQNTWAHVVFTANRDGSLKTFVNGAKVGETDFSSWNNYDLSNNLPLVIGGNPVNPSAYPSPNVAIAGFSIFRKELSESEVLELYSNSWQ